MPIEGNDNEKIIYQNIKYKYVKDGNILEEYFLKHSINSLKVDELVNCDENIIEFAEIVKKSIQNTFQNNFKKEISEQQLKFSYDCTRLILGSPYESSKPIIIPAKAGFGKSTLINTIIRELIRKNKKIFSQQDAGLILVSDRVTDLKAMQQDIRNEFGYYNSMKNTDWIFVLEGWNPLRCYQKIKKFQENSCNERNCKFFKDCYIYKQRNEQLHSPILAMTNERFAHYQAQKIYDYKNYTDTFGINHIRKIVIIDEKPKLEKSHVIDDSLLAKLELAVNDISVKVSDTAAEDKSSMKKEINCIRSKINLIEDTYMDYRNALVINNESSVLSKLIATFKKYYKYEYSNDLAALQTFFEVGGLYCRTEKRSYFKTIGYAQLELKDLNVFIFDATSEGDSSYADIFNYMNIDDYKDYSNLTFYIIKENMSRSALKDRPTKLDAVCSWINNYFKTMTYVVTYQMYSKKLSEELQHNNNIIKYDVTGTIPYFGNTKGKNDFNECENMVQIGWNRLPSDEIISSYLCVNVDLKMFKEFWFDDHSKREKIQQLLQVKKGKFVNDQIEIHMLQKMMAEFEQEVFRTKVRNFGENEPVNIYLFDAELGLQNMIRERFTNCKIKPFKIVELDLNKNKPSNGEKKEKILYDYLKNEWNGEAKLYDDIKSELDITNTNWTKLLSKQSIKNLFVEMNIKSQKIGNKWALVIQ